jgi:hypothetical protein
MLVEQERRAVQTHGGLAGAGPALHDEAGGERRADHLVLLRGDRGDDVPHLPGPLALQLGQERIGDAAVVGGVDAVGVIEHLVHQVVEAAAGHHESPPPAQSERVDRRRAVERHGHLGSPVDHHRVAAVVLDVTAAHVPAGPVLAVEPAEAQPGHLHVEGAEAVRQVLLRDRGVHRLGGTLGDRGRARRPVPHGGEAAVGLVEIRLLGVDVGMGHARNLCASGGEAA